MRGDPFKSKENATLAYKQALVYPRPRKPPAPGIIENHRRRREKENHGLDREDARSQEDAHPGRLIRYVGGALVDGAQELLVDELEVAVVVLLRTAVLVALAAVNLDMTRLVSVE
jgi:hypothetical protein